MGAPAKIQDGMTVGDLVARYLADIGVKTVFGVISIHNMPILDAIACQGRIRFVPARGEAGALNMADAYARVSRGLGVCITSTGTAAGNAAGAQAEALTAGSRVLHITSTVDSDFMDRDRAAIHDVPRQPEMLKGVSKRFVRMWDAKGAAGALEAAVVAALEPPSGPVSLEIPVDVQRQPVAAAGPFACPKPARRAPDATLIAEAARRILAARRPLLWLGGGARGAEQEARELHRRGFCVVTSTNGRAVVPENAEGSLGAFNMTPEAEEIYRQADLMLVVGSRLRGNETRNNRMVLPSPLLQIDAEPSQNGRNYPADLFIGADARLALRALLAALPAKLAVDEQFSYAVSVARARSEGALRSRLGPYQTVADVLQERVSPGAHPFVRDVTIANSTFGNRYVQVAEPHHGVHALGGGIGQGIAMAVGAALAGEAAKTVTLVGDGGAQLGLAELITAVDENAPIVFVLMNDKAYGVIQNIQDAQYAGRRHYSQVRTPDFAKLCDAVGLRHSVVRRVEDFARAFDVECTSAGPGMIEIDMTAIGPFAESFAGPPAGAAGGAR